jgi:dUTPase
MQHCTVGAWIQKGALLAVPCLSQPSLCVQIKTGDRIAQLILERISIADVQVVDDLDATDRGEGGFGSTGGFGKQQEAKPTA